MANPSKVYLLSVPLEKDYSHTLYFSSASAQQSYFSGKVKKTFTDFSYQRKDGVIRVPAHVDTLYSVGVNYVMYQNPDYGNRWFYAFITGMEYKNDEVTFATIKTDVLQTWLFDIKINPCFVEREHAASDEIGEHTVEEGLELGEYQCNLHSMSGYAGDHLSIVIGVTKTADGENVHGKLYNSMYSGVRYYAFDEADYEGVNEFLTEYDTDGAGEAVTCMFLAPRPIAPVSEDHIVPNSAVTKDYYINGSETAGSVMKDFSRLDLEGYEPRNKKLLTYPYRYLLVGNNAGASVPFRYEWFRNYNTGAVIDPVFRIEGVLTPGCSIRMLPLYYAGAYINDEHGVNMGKFPILNWTSDIYTNWLTQNGVNLAVSVVTGLGQMALGTAAAIGSGGLAAGVGATEIVGGASQIMGVVGQIHQASFSPPQAKGNLNSGDVVTATKRNDFHFYDMTIRKEFAEIIDGFFDMYGYKCNKVKTPAKAHRAAYWYTKTIDANISGNIPQDDLQEIKDCYNRGLTFWRSGADFRNYNADNSIV